ncbi:uncharacterized protein LOC135848256 isoform X1 [Planococcus citri]|uniref:uncharacterized protein LOC135848256 isoform X1 n=1 Tax=Planococcus citri TaxID=170843 RepID=UPI0031F91B9A
MEVEMNMELEMAEVRPRVYDILHPTPVPLKQLSAIVTSFEVWRYEMNTHRMRNNLSDFFENREYCNIKLKTILPDIPRVINDLVQEYIEKFQRSLKEWFNRHYETFRSYNSSKRENCILNDFDDFVTDFKGDVDYVRTAERMMRCDRLDDTVKFKIACIYCFEDDIRRIWPSVCEVITSRVVNFTDELQYWNYWIGILTNQSDKTDVREDDHVAICESIFVNCVTSENRSSMEYFWNRLRPDNRLEKTSDLLDNDDECVARFILPKLDDQQLSKFVNKYGCFLMTELLDYQLADGIDIVPTWMYIRNFMNESQFVELSEYMLIFLTSKLGGDNTHKLFFCRKIWNSAPHYLKQTAARKILSSTELFNKLVSGLNKNGISESTPMFVKLLLNFLPSATFDERSSFWNNCWHQLIAVARCKYLQQFIKLCFGNEVDITRFKTNVMANSEHLRQLCISLVKDVNFGKLKDLLKFCYPEVQQARNFKKEILQLALLGEDYKFSCRERDIEPYAYVLNSFINKTYNDADLSAEFKYMLMISPAFEKFVSLRVRSTDIGDLIEIKRFVEEFKLTEPTLVQIKTRIIDSFKESLTGDGSSRDLLKKRSLDYFLSWCLGSEAEVEEFKRNHALIVEEEEEEEEEEDW